MNHYDPINPISSTLYANDARAKIKDILSRNKTPVIEGGSPFYIHQIFNPNLTNFNDDTFKEARNIARRIIELDGNNFGKTLARAEEIFIKL
jgi:tRNA A37 N6-isopentenylltransferase MiaA